MGITMAVGSCVDALVSPHAGLVPHDDLISAPDDIHLLGLDRVLEGLLIQNPSPWESVAITDTIAVFDLGFDANPTILAPQEDHQVHESHPACRGNLAEYTDALQGFLHMICSHCRTHPLDPWRAFHPL